MKKLFVLISAITLAPPVFSSEYEDCLLENMKGVTSDYAARKIDESCKAKHSDANNSATSSQKEASQNFIELEMNGGLFSSTKPTYRLPMPSGNWEKIAENKFTSSGGTPMSTQIFANIENGKGKNIAIITYSKSYSSGGNWSSKFCKRTNLHFIENYESRGSFRLNCLGVNHFRIVGGKSNKVNEAAKNWAKKNNIAIPRTMVLHQHVISNNNFLQVQVFYNPELEGFPPTVDSNWNSNDWHQDKIFGDAERLAYIQKILDEGKRYHALYKAEFDKHD